MALFLDLPVYKVCNELYTEFVLARRTLPRTERYTVGQELDRAIVEVLVLIQRINSTREKLHLELSENKTHVCSARQGVEFLGAFIKPHRTYVAAHTFRRIRNHIHSISPRMSLKRAQAVVNCSLGVLSHYDSYLVREVMNYKSGLCEFGRFSDDGLRFYPDALSWRIFQIRGSCRRRVNSVCRSVPLTPRRSDVAAPREEIAVTKDKFETTEV